MIDSGLVRMILTRLTISVVCITLVSCDSGNISTSTVAVPTTDAAPSSIQAPTQTPTTQPTTAPSVTVTSPRVPPTPTAIALSTPPTTPTPTAQVVSPLSVPDAVRTAAQAFVEIQFYSGGVDGGFVTQAISISSTGLVLSRLEEVAADELRFGSVNIYQAAIAIPDTVERLHVPIRKLETFPVENLLLFLLRQNSFWRFVEVTGTATVEPGDDVYSLGIHEVERFSRSTAADTTGPQILAGTVVSVETKDGLIEIQHSTNLATIPGTGPLLDRNGRLIGFNTRASRKLGPNGFEPLAFATAVELPELLRLFEE